MDDSCWNLRYPLVFTHPSLERQHPSSLSSPVFSLVQKVWDNLDEFLTLARPGGGRLFKRKGGKERIRIKLLLRVIGTAIPCCDLPGPRRSRSRNPQAKRVARRHQRLSQPDHVTGERRAPAAAPIGWRRERGV